ncbi:MAG TPA: hypothetical protein VN426_11455, partial [Syntrophomonadaceae bacterium]|nr:hypothetical protein [Syntrophomonadaceae bacterium]
MRKIFRLTVLLICLTLALGGCGKNITNSQTSDKTVNGPQLVNETKSSIPKSQNNITSMTDKEIRQYLNLNKSKILQMIGPDYENGNVSVIESHMQFPYVYARGIAFVFPNNVDDLFPTYLY